MQWAWFWVNWMLLPDLIPCAVLSSSLMIFVLESPMWTPVASSLSSSASVLLNSQAGPVTPEESQDWLYTPQDSFCPVSMSYVPVYLQSLPLAIPAAGIASLMASVLVILSSELQSCVSSNCFDIFLWVPTGPSSAIFLKLTFPFLTPTFHMSIAPLSGLWAFATQLPLLRMHPRPQPTFCTWLLILLSSA